ncbi:MAG: ribosome-associated heat shock protein Hsp15 [Dinoroseobacter sp.]|jgi:ribosome-associated heat shock protein Hsp15
MARFFKTRSLAAKLVSGGGVRLNGARVSKTSTAIKQGDTLTFLQGCQVRVVQLNGIAKRRGPAPEAQTLYADLSPAPDGPPPPRVGARPTKKDRRNMDALRDDPEG